MKKIFIGLIAYSLAIFTAFYPVKTFASDDTNIEKEDVEGNQDRDTDDTNSATEKQNTEKKIKQRKANKKDKTPRRFGDAKGDGTLEID